MEAAYQPIPLLDPPLEDVKEVAMSMKSDPRKKPASSGLFSGCPQLNPCLWFENRSQDWLFTATSVHSFPVYT